MTFINWERKSIFKYSHSYWDATT